MGIDIVKLKAANNEHPTDYVPFFASQMMSNFVAGERHECWPWGGALNGKGYGIRQYTSGDVRIQIRAHRFTYQLVFGLIPVGVHLDHLCRNRRCVNPWHLEPVDIKTNVLRGVGVSAVNARKTHCIRGHKFTAANTRQTKKGRHCRECDRLRMREYRLKMREATQ